MIKLNNNRPDRVVGEKDLMISVIPSNKFLEAKLVNIDFLLSLEESFLSNSIDILT